MYVKAHFFATHFSPDKKSAISVHMVASLWQGKLILTRMELLGHCLLAMSHLHLKDPEEDNKHWVLLIMSSQQGYVVSPLLVWAAVGWQWRSKGALIICHMDERFKKSPKQRSQMLPYH